MTSTPYLSTADHFTDAMNTRRVIRERAVNREHFDALTEMLSLTHRDVISRYGVGAAYTEASNTISFVDGSACVERDGRWFTIPSRLDAA